MIKNIKTAAEIIRKSKRVTVFTGAGISVESGIPPFRGPEGLWSKYDPNSLDIERFYENPQKAWTIIKEIFYDFFGKAKPNQAHKVLALMEESGFVKTLITQNIDNLHHIAGSKNVVEFHGTSGRLVCTKCDSKFSADESFFVDIPPICSNCKGILKPDFIFFGEPIPERARKISFREAKISDLFILIGTTGEVMPASMIPVTAKQYGSQIIEVNTDKSHYTDYIVDIHLRGKASEIMNALFEKLNLQDI